MGSQNRFGGRTLLYIARATPFPGRGGTWHDTDAERVAADDDGVDPSWDGSRNTLEDDWLAEDGAAKDVADLATREKVTSGRRPMKMAE